MTALNWTFYALCRGQIRHSCVLPESEFQTAPIARGESPFLSITIVRRARVILRNRLSAEKSAGPGGSLLVAMGNGALTLSPHTHKDLCISTGLCEKPEQAPPASLGSLYCSRPTPHGALQRKQQTVSSALAQPG